MTQSPATPPVCDARELLDSMIEFYTSRPSIDQERYTPNMCEMSNRECHDLVVNLLKIKCAIPAPPPAADEARMLATRLKQISCLADRYPLSDSDIAILDKSAALISRIPSEEATTIDCWEVVSAWWERNHKRGFVTGDDIDDLLHSLSAANLRITRAPGAGA